ncbi:TPA: N-acetylmannosamine-6-phosphate 2-epimerase [Klebsiella aerogenes]|uniref:N-acetylmannosamine-6-phosphate 2-epimerase n=1 Tax=Klebsiella sp. CN_Kp084 TaxID=3153414 RepID=UPI0022893AD4|nr:N-acetylmannosamine-6-phosphate 2-epimerase [Klebsiella aerogenes]HCM6942065.1 N-acetylmannosamine-6-phosphate 2-epimerase [Klebsiella aerogenes]HCT3749620.1 N-acetylmannosamine-6-phosphate 2-epimerase [Klebsiella aerogenes]HCT8625688.1 N-acetylmannosamine-6-phosphate 2-epimerase [Klebsiella aerogenes]HCT8634717.1 N-acetylmannosamine-6-phosphate 2-epimerase [Klebsiella aerogenes]
MSLFAQLNSRIRQHGGLIVSCQPVPGSPLDNPQIVAAMALAAEQAGAVALRIEGLNNLQAVRSLVTVPIIGLIKRDLHESPVRITPWVEDIVALAQGGADIIAIDGTQRQRPVPVSALLAEIHHQGKVAMADCSSQADALQCWQLGAEIVGTTLSGYTAEETPDEPDLALVKSLSAAGCRVIAEGRYNTPAQAAEAMRHGAWAVTVGSAITRLEHICGWYNTALKKAVSNR